VSYYTGVNGENEEERDIKRLHIGARAKLINATKYSQILRFKIFSSK